MDVAASIPPQEMLQKQTHSHASEQGPTGRASQSTGSRARPEGTQLPCPGLPDSTHSSQQGHLPTCAYHCELQNQGHGLLAEQLQGHQLGRAGPVHCRLVGVDVDDVGDHLDGENSPTASHPESITRQDPTGSPKWQPRYCIPNCLSRSSFQKLLRERSRS